MARRLNVVLEDELHTEIKILVAKKNITISQFVIEAVKEKLKKELERQKMIVEVLKKNEEIRKRMERDSRKLGKRTNTKR